MEFFERAHVSRKKADPSKKENKSEEAVKKQLKQMLQAYKKGNNQEIKNFAVTEYKYDIDDLKSMSDYSDTSFFKEVGNIPKTVDPRASDRTQSSIGHNSSFSNELSSSKSYISGTGHENTEESLESVTEFEFKSQSSSQDISTTDKDFTSSFGNSSLLSEFSEDSDVSIPSSLLTSSGTSEMSDDGVFDPDGALATKILEKLGKKPTHSKKRQLIKEANAADGNFVMRDKQKVREILGNLEIAATKEKKPKKAKNEEITNTKAFKVLEPKDITSKYKDMSDNSFCGDDNLDDSLSSNNSSQFISVTALNMESQCLSDVIGDYVHPTIRNLPSEKQNVVYSQSSKYAILEEISSMSADQIDEVSSLVPEIDEELAIEDLTLDVDAEVVDDSITHDDTVQTEDYFEHETSTEDIETASVPFKLYNGRNQYILVMKHPAELYLHGKVKVTAIGGSVEIFGYALREESVNIYAPYCYFAYNIKTFDNHGAFHGLFGKLTSVGLTMLEADEACRMVTEQDAVISLSKLDCPKIDYVDDNFIATELFSKRSDQTPKFLKKAAESLGCSMYLDKPKRVFDEKSNWDQIVTYGMNYHSRGIVCGGKGTGKSTFLRYYTNRLLSKGPVLVIDLDPGQAEFTVPGNISVNVVHSPLIGPNFTHLRKPEKTLNIAMINPMDNTSRYMSAVNELIDYCYSSAEYHSMPWIVNTMGMTNNIGLKFMVYIILKIQPTFLYQINSKVAKKRFEFELQSCKIKNLYEEYKKNRFFSALKDPYSVQYEFISSVNEESINQSSPQKGNSFALSPKDERYLNVLAYFGEMLNVYAKSILDIVPYEVSIRDFNIGVNVKIPEEALTKVINGKIIALCTLTAADKGKMFTLADKALLCHGNGLIRGINYEKGLLFIVTPVPIEELSLVNALVYADWMPELRGLEKELSQGTVVPYRTATVFHQRRLMFPPRRRFNPIQLLKATRSS